MSQSLPLWISYLVLASTLMMVGGLLIWAGLPSRAVRGTRLALCLLLSAAVVAAAVAATLEVQRGW